MGRWCVVVVVCLLPFSLPRTNEGTNRWRWRWRRRRRRNQSRYGDEEKQYRGNEGHQWALVLHSRVLRHVRDARRCVESHPRRRPKISSSSLQRRRRFPGSIVVCYGIRFPSPLGKRGREGKNEGSNDGRTKHDVAGSQAFS